MCRLRKASQNPQLTATFAHTTIRHSEHTHPSIVYFVALIEQPRKESEWETLEAAIEAKRLWELFLNPNLVMLTMSGLPTPNILS